MQERKRKAALGGQSLRSVSYVENINDQGEEGKRIHPSEHHPVLEIQFERMIKERKCNVIEASRPNEIREFQDEESSASIAEQRRHENGFAKKDGQEGKVRKQGREEIARTVLSGEFSARLFAKQNPSQSASA